MSTDRIFTAKIEELLGDRGAKPNRAVRFRDLDKALASASTAEVAKIAEKVARKTAESYSGADTDLSQLQQDIQTAQQAANLAGTDAQNALSAANGAGAYTDQQVQQARDDLAVDFGAAQTAAGQAAGYALDAHSSLLTATAGIARIFPTDFLDGPSFWSATYAGSPAAVSTSLTSDHQLLNEAVVGNFYRIVAGRTVLRAILSRAISEFSEGRVIRITVKFRMVGAVSSALRFAVASLRQDFTLVRTLGTGIVATPSAPDQWQEGSTEIALPARQEQELYFRAGIVATAGTSPDVPIDIASIRIEDVTSLKAADESRAQASIARDDAVVARQDAESAAASASTSLNMLSEVAGRSNAVISDTFLVSSDWVRYGSEGTLTKLPNSVYPVGRDWRFSVSGTQNDGIA
ncbi:hypothetical protein, partial [Paracoccus sp. (in: a-proteobacteria)]|uniref:hypothetical protein n=1 Tax=Paracoccus sp. TaxID=267 RepID=UPI003A83C444